MGLKDGRNGVILLAVLIAVALAASLYTTQLTISDTDPSTYIAIPMLMLPVFALFFAKEQISPRVKKRDICAALIIFIALILLTAYLRISLSYLFASYSVEMLLFPLLIASFIILIFGLANLKRFWPLLLYAVFASPVLLIPIINLNSLFAAFNTQIVYHLLGVFVQNARYIAPITIIANGYTIGIGESCVGIGLLIAIILLLAPVAWLYYGKPIRKLLWVFSGLLLLFLLNLMRMLIIAASWVTYGPTSALILFHEFAGILLFYAAVIIILLISHLYGITLVSKNRFVQKHASRHGRGSHIAYNKVAIVLAVAFSFLYLLLNIGYSNISVSPYLLNTLPQSQSAPLLNSISAKLYTTQYLFGVRINSTSSGAYMLLYNKTNTSITINSPILLYFTYNNSGGKVPIFVNSSMSDELSFLASTGVRQDVYYTVSNGTPFIFYRSTVPYSTNSSYSLMTFYAIVPASDMKTAVCSSESVYSYMFNTIELKFYNSTVSDEMAKAACIIGGSIYGTV